MAPVDCNRCFRKHERSVGVCCLYYKKALDTCSTLGVSPDDYVKYLPPLDTVLEEARAATPARTEFNEDFSMSPSDVMAVLKDNAECKRVLREQKSQLENLTSQIDRLSILVTSNMASPDVKDGRIPPGFFPPSTTTSQTMGSNVVTTTQSTGLPLPFANSQPALVPSTWSTWSQLQGGNTSGAQQVGWPAVPVPGLVSTPAITQFGIPQPGLHSWMGATATRTGLLPGTMGDPSGFIPPTTTNGPAAAGPTVAAAGRLDGAPWSSTTNPTGGSAYAGTAPWTGSTWASTSVNPLGGPPVTLMVDASGIKAATRKRKCVVFDIEPHLYVDQKSATIDDVISANMSLLESLLSLGLPVRNFAKHVRFLADKSKVFTSASLLKYDLAMREKADLLGPQVFCYGDHELYHAYLGVENVKPKAKQSGATTQVKTSKLKRGVCWKFNKPDGCKRDACRWKHECRDCSGAHGFPDCDSKK